MYCYQPPLQHMYCTSQPAFHQVGMGQWVPFLETFGVVWVLLVGSSYV